MILLAPLETHVALRDLLALAEIDADLAQGEWDMPLRAGALLDSAIRKHTEPPIDIKGTPLEWSTLTEAEKILLQTLYKAAPHPVSTADLLSVLGYRPDLDTHTLATHIWRLRQKLGADSVRTQDGGYALALSK